MCYCPMNSSSYYYYSCSFYCYYEYDDDYYAYYYYIYSESYGRKNNDNYMCTLHVITAFLINYAIPSPLRHPPISSPPSPTFTIFFPLPNRKRYPMHFHPIPNRNRYPTHSPPILSLPPILLFSLAPEIYGNPVVFLAPHLPVLIVTNL